MFISRTAFGLALAVAASATIAGAQSGDPLAPGQDWRLVSLNGEDFASLARFNIAIDNRMAGKAPCNTFLGTVEGDASSFKIGPIAATRMACDHLEDETRFLDGLDKARSARLDGETLIFTGEGGLEMVFEKAEPNN
jgi:heat shock protein HslJ